MKYFLIFLMNGEVQEIASNDEEEARNRAFDFWKDALERSGGTYQREYTFNELQTLDQAW